jgi:hypothetical protein
MNLDLAKERFLLPPAQGHPDPAIIEGKDMD